MLLPISDEPNAEETPWATYGLIAINVAVWLLACWPQMGQPVSFASPGALEYVDTLRRELGGSRLDVLSQISAYDLLLFRYGYRPAAPHIESLITCLFLHGGWMHLGGNMLFLHIFGDNVEARVGRARFVLLYLVCGVVATLFYAAFRPQAAMPLVGASGAISGILGCYFVWFPHNRVKVLYSFFFFIERAMVPARIVLLFYFVLENLLPFLFGHAGSHGTAYGAHLGGFVAGYGYALYDQYAPRSPRAAPRAKGRPFATRLRDAFDGPRRVSEDDSARLCAEVASAVASRQYARGLAHLYALPQSVQSTVPATAMLTLADYLTEQRRYDEALRLLRRLLRPEGIEAAELGRVHLRMGLIYLRGLRRPSAAYPHLLDVLDLPAELAVQEAARAALAEIEGR